MKTILVCGAGGFIGNHLVRKLKSQGHIVYGIDIKHPEWSKSEADFFAIGDLTDPEVCEKTFDKPYDEVYQLSALMGGAGYIFIGSHDADIMHNSQLINLNVAHYAVKAGVKKLFYSSSACVYRYGDTKEEQVLDPDSNYGWEKLFSEKLFLAYKKNYGLDVKVARFHNIFGPEGAYKGGREKSMAAICRKVIEATDEIEVWGDGEQTRSYLYIDELLEGIERFMASDFSGPLNLGSAEMVSINQLIDMCCELKGKKLKVNHIDGPQGVRVRTSDNTLILEKLNWQPTKPLKEGLLTTYTWIKDQMSL